MAENKNGFILYTDLVHVVRKLVLKDRENKTNYAGELFLHILEYVNDTDPVPINFIVDMAFEPIKQTLKRDLIKYRLSIKKQSESGILGNLKRWHKDLYTKVINNEINIYEANKIAKNRKESPPDNPRSQSIGIIADNDSDSDSDSVSDTLYYESEEDFLADWKKAREAILKLPTNIQKLNSEESRIFQEAKENYSIDYFRNAMQGLFVQKNMFPSNQLRPTHFFRDMNFEKYNDCFVNKRQLFEDKKQQQKL
jgi:hypothetical protein